MDNYLLVKLQDGYCIIHISKCKIESLAAEFIYKENKYSGPIILNGI
jgi:hypothetical protein